jgi:signal transduction histidine kinase
MSPGTQGFRRPSLSLRLRLTLSYGAVFFAVALVMVLLGYLLLREALIHDPAEFLDRLAAALHLPPSYLNDQIATPSGGEQTVGAFMRQVQDETVDTLLHGLAVVSFWALAIAAAVSIGLGWLVAGRMLRPLNEIVGVARSLSASTLDKRIGLGGPRDELKVLADTFDEMLDRLEATFATQREFAANASHELRTPLAVVRTELDVTLADQDATLEDYRRMAETMRRAVARSEDVVEKLLVLAQSEELLDRRDVDLAVLTNEVIARYRPAADTRDLTFSADLQPTHVTGDPALLESLADNLIDNAVRYAPEGEVVAVATQCDGAVARLRVENSAETVSVEDLARLFERFYRRETSRSRAKGGSGLGLAIVAAVAEVHGGSVHAESRAAGVLVITVELPCGDHHE